MSKRDKLLHRFRLQPVDFTWDELVTFLNQLGYSLIEKSGSRVKFYNMQFESLIQIHKPHPGKIIKRYMMREILNTLVEVGLV